MRRRLKRFLSILLAGVISVSSVASTPMSASAQESAMVKESADGETVDVAQLNGYMGMEAVEVTSKEVAQANASYDNTIKFAQNNLSDKWQKYSSYYLYNQLDEEEKDLWDQMYTICLGILNGQEDITSGYTAYATIVPKTSWDNNRIRHLTCAFAISNPQFYFIRKKYSYCAESRIVSIAFCVYENFCDGSVRAEATSEFCNNIELWEEDINEEENELEKVQKVHEIVIMNTKYNNSVVSDSVITESEEEENYTQSAYSMVCMGITVCAGYAQSVTLLCNGAGIDAISVTSSDHQWNKVCVNDSWYNVDATWDDAGNSPYYIYFLKSQEDISDVNGHHLEESFWGTSMPACSQSASVNNSVVTLVDVEETTSRPVIFVEALEGQYKITITDSTTGAKIYCTTDGVTTPSSAYTKSNLYTEPFTVKDYKKVKAMAVCDTYYDSLVVSPECIHENTTTKNKVSVTCTVDGYTGDTYCEDCETYIAYGTEVEAMGHQHTKLVNQKEATCSEKGCTGDTYCEDCETYIAYGDEIEATGHQHTKLVNQKEATCSEKGYTGDTYCEDCETYIAYGIEVEATGHQHTKLVNQKEATCSEKGYTGDTYCEDCGEKIEIGNETKALGHVYSGKVTKAADTKTIADSAYANNKKITKIVVKNNIKSIGKKAFYKCTKLKTLTIGTNVTAIGANAFYGCKKLKTITINSCKLTSKTVSKNAFKGISKTTIIKVPKKKYAAYKKLFRKKGLSSKVKIKKK